MCTPDTARQDAPTAQDVRDVMATELSYYIQFTLEPMEQDARLVDEDGRKAHRIRQKIARVARLNQELLDGEFITADDRRYLVTILKARAWFELPWAQDHGLEDTEETVEEYAATRVD